MASLWTQSTSVPALRAHDRRVPLEAGQVFPYFGVLFLRVGELREQAALAEFGELEVAWRARAPAAGLGVVEQRPGRDRLSGVSSSENSRPWMPGRNTSPLAWNSTSPRSRRHSSTVSWLSSMPTSPRNTTSNLDKCFERVGKLLDVVLVAAAHFVEPRVEQQAGKLDARIARQGVPQIAILPARHRLDQQHAELFFADRDRHREAVVVGDGFARLAAGRPG